MNTLDLDFSAMVSGQMAEILKQTDSDGEPLFLGYRDFYLIPSFFESHVKQLPAQLWPGEFRRARDMVKECMKKYGAIKWEGVQIGNILAGVWVSHHLLSREMVPEIDQELKIKYRNQSVKVKKIPADLPPQIVRAADQDLISEIFGALESAGYLDSSWKPTSSVPTNRDAAYMARAIGHLLGVYEWSNAFSGYWSVPNLSAQASQAKVNLTRKKIDKVLASAVNNNARLKGTAEGKALLKKNKFIS